jgi:hypothetical protein
MEKVVAARSNGSAQGRTRAPVQSQRVTDLIKADGVRQLRKEHAHRMSVSRASRQTILLSNLNSCAAALKTACAILGSDSGQISLLVRGLPQPHVKDLINFGFTPPAHREFINCPVRVKRETVLQGFD